jgi:D-3-phosphoglycerate dehydrogenase
VPDFCFDEVADTAMSLILSVPRKVHLVNAAVHKGIWNKDAAKPVRKFRGATLGIFAFGNIGRNVAKRAIPFGFRILVHDAYLAPDQVRDYTVTLVDFDTLLRESDLLTVHAPLTDETRQRFNEAAFRKMKPSAYFFNLGRGPIHDQKAIVSGAHGALDRAPAWTSGERPPDPRSDLEADNVVFTPHYASYTEEAYRELQLKTAQNAAAALKGDFPTYVVNPEVKATARLLAWKPQ